MQEHTTQQHPLHPTSPSQRERTGGRVHVRPSRQVNSTRSAVNRASLIRVRTYPLHHLTFIFNAGVRMIRPASPRLFLTLALVSVGTLTLAGCYKTEYETEKTRADGLEKKSTEAQSSLDKTRTDLQAALGRVQTAESQLAASRAGGSLVTLVDGKPYAQDAVKWDGQRWVRHGDCQRAGGTIRFDSGRLIDQPVMLVSPSGKPFVTGQIRASHPDGEWIWFDADGKPATKEAWKDARLTDLSRANNSTGVLTWEKLGKKDRDAWARSSANTLRDLPELVRDTSPPPPPPPAAEKTKPAASTPKKTTKPAR